MGKKASVQPADPTVQRQSQDGVSTGYLDDTEGQGLLKTILPKTIWDGIAPTLGPALGYGIRRRKHRKPEE